MSALGTELVNEALEGMRKRKRLEEYERSSLKEWIARKWKKDKLEVKMQIANGAARPVFLIDTTDKCREHTPTVTEVLDALPEDIQEMRRADSKEHGYFVTIHETDKHPGQYELVFSIHEAVEAKVKAGYLRNAYEGQDE